MSPLVEQVERLEEADNGKHQSIHCYKDGRRGSSGEERGSSRSQEETPQTGGEGKLLLD